MHSATVIGRFINDKTARDARHRLYLFEIPLIFRCEIFLLSECWFCLLKMFDMIRPKEEGKIRLSDLKSCSLAPTFFDTFINLDKYLDHEQRDPFTSLRVTAVPFVFQRPIQGWKRGKVQRRCLGKSLHW